MGRATQWVKLIRLRDEDSIASVAKVSRFESDKNEYEENENNNESQETNIEADNSSDSDEPNITPEE
jgi:DNA gyrase subunit A